MKVTVGPSSNVAFQAATDRGVSSQISVTQNNATRVTFSSSTGTGGVGEAYNQANAAFAAANSAANTVRVSANSASTITKANGINFVNTNSITVSVEAGINGNANVSFITTGAAVSDAYNQANNAYNAANLKLNIAGGSITGSLNVLGNLTVSGNTTYYNVTTYSVADPLIYLASNNETSDVVDIGFMGGKNTSGVYNHTGLARDATDATWYLFDGLADEGHVNNVIDFANTSLASLRANILANNIQLVGNTVATQANLTFAYNQANSAYSAANNRVLKSGDTMTGPLVINYVGVGLNVNTAAEFTNSVSIGNNISGIYMVDDINGFASIEIGGASGGYIDFKMPVGEDFDFRIYSQHAQTEFISANTSHKLAIFGSNVAFDTNTLAVDVVNKRVGVGTNTPSANLEVVGIANVTNTISTNTVNFGFGVYDLTSNTFQTTSNDLIEVDSFAAAAYSTVKYIVQVKTGVNLHATELFCIQDGVSTYLTEYATLISGSPLGTFSINLAGGRMKLNFNPDNPSNNILTFKVVRYTISA